MLNRRSTLFNLVTLTITSNVSSTITCNGQTYSSVTSATFRIRQGTEVTWSVSADGYVSQSGTEVMDGNKEVGVSLNPETVSFTITTNVAATITINGKKSTGVTSKKLKVPKNSSVSWEVSASGYITQSGTYDIGSTKYTMNVELSAKTFYVSLYVYNRLDSKGIDGSIEFGNNVRDSTIMYDISGYSYCYPHSSSVNSSANYKCCSTGDTTLLKIPVPAYYDDFYIGLTANGRILYYLGGSSGGYPGSSSGGSSGDSSSSSGSSDRYVYCDTNLSWTESETISMPDNKDSLPDGYTITTLEVYGNSKLMYSYWSGS